MENTDFVTIVGPDAHMKGELFVEADTCILGKFEGSITAKGKLHIAEGATCEAHIEAAELIIDGVIEGNLAAGQRIQLNRTAVVYGDIMSPRFIVEEGASIRGHVQVGSAPAEQEEIDEIDAYEAVKSEDMVMSSGPSAE